MDVSVIGKGGCAEAVEYGEGKICKLFYKGQPEEFVRLEYENSIEMYKSGVKVPKTFGIINIKDRMGIIYERIYGKSLWGLLRRESLAEEAINIFVNSHCDILSRKSKNLLSYKDVLKTVIAMSTNSEIFMSLGRTCELKNLLSYKKYISSIDINTNMESELIKEIYNLPDGDYICHGDFHPDNVLIKSNGETFVIDFMNVCSGPVLYDVARTFYGLNEASGFLAFKYLSKINVSKDAISPYIKVIEKCREYEIRLNGLIRSGVSVD